MGLLEACLGEVLKDGAAVPAPGAGDALILYISCQEAGRSDDQME